MSDIDKLEELTKYWFGLSPEKKEIVKKMASLGKSRDFLEGSIYACKYIDEAMAKDGLLGLNSALNDVLMSSLLVYYKKELNILEEKIWIN